uniref:Uncharacterized protein n=1 Tax=Electrophorus electricus TaxID=8005 RepID=A0A4W4HQA8_ELEEL
MCVLVANFSKCQTSFSLVVLCWLSAVDPAPVCPLSLAGALHPVQAQLERFGAGPGCAAKEGGAKETHVISVEKASHSPDKQVKRTDCPSVHHY